MPSSVPPTGRPSSGCRSRTARYGSKYAKGMVQGPAFPVFVSTGIGMTILPVRMLVRPEIVIFTLVPK